MTVPLGAVWLLGEANTREVEPLVGTHLIIAGNHVAVGHIVAKAEGGLVTRLRLVILSSEHSGALVARAKG